MYPWKCSKVYFYQYFNEQSYQNRWHLAVTMFQKRWFREHIFRGTISLSNFQNISKKDMILIFLWGNQIKRRTQELVSILMIGPKSLGKNISIEIRIKFIKILVKKFHECSILWGNKNSLWRYILHNIQIYYVFLYTFKSYLNC